MIWDWISLCWHAVFLTQEVVKIQISPICLLRWQWLKAHFGCIWHSASHYHFYTFPYPPAPPSLLHHSPSLWNHPAGGLVKTVSPAVNPLLAVLMAGGWQASQILALQGGLQKNFPKSLWLWVQKFCLDAGKLTTKFTYGCLNHYFTFFTDGTGRQPSVLQHQHYCIVIRGCICAIKLLKPQT